MSNWRLGAAALTASMTLSQAPAAYADTRVGVTSAVNPSAAGTPPGADTRQLTVGSDIIFRERLITTTDGQAQILFLDQSSLLIGPNSTVVIDEFVYDPATNKGNIAATLTQGSFRYIGGKLSKQGAATLKTPVATLGIRGSDVTVGYDAASRSMNVVTTHGLASLTAGNDVINLRGGFGLTVSGNDSKAGAPIALTAAQIAAANKQFEGLPGKTAGAGKPPTDGDVASSGLSDTVEAKGLASIEPAAGGAGDGPSFLVPFAPGNNDNPPVPLPTSNSSSPPPPPPPPPPQPDRVLNGYAGGLASGPGSSAVRYAVRNSSPGGVELQLRTGSDGVRRAFVEFQYSGVGPQGPTDVVAKFASAENVVDAFTFEALNAGPGKFNGNDAATIGAVVSAPGTTLCSCEFLTWGAWALTLQTASGPHNATGFWAGGELPQVTDPSPTGKATFSGLAVGTVYNPSSSTPLYATTGQFTNKYDFSQRSGRVKISDFDGRTFKGGVSATNSDWRHYSGTLSGYGGFTGTVNGSFYGNRNAAGQLQVPKNTAGNFAVSNGSYSASGVFLGSR
ncbi:MAG TPA: FecR domain-containing protein [Alphaproteobacteria bacterium]|nr:FecR domain-containing protein [Alphaproteobacteria bacterium]